MWFETRPALADCQRNIQRSSSGGRICRELLIYAPYSASAFRQRNLGRRKRRGALRRTANGIFSAPVPVAGFAENFSSMPRTAPPPFGREIWGAENGEGLCVGLPVAGLSVTTRSAGVSEDLTSRRIYLEGRERCLVERLCRARR